MTTYVSATYHKEKLTAEYIADDGSKLLRIGGSASWRFFNPGNLRPASKITHVGQIGIGEITSGKFSIFSSYEAGRAAKKATLLRVYSDNTIPSMMERYAPRSEKLGGGNNTDDYIKYLLDHTGIPKTKKVGELNDSALESLMNAMQAREGFKVGTEKKLAVSDITVSDGARPIPNAQIKVEVNGKEKVVTTTKEGKVPPIVHKAAGENVKVSAKNSKGEWTPIFEYGSSYPSNYFSMSRDLYTWSAMTGVHDAKSIIPSKPEPIRYVVQPKDVLSKIATKFKTTVEKIQKDNHLKNPNKIYPRQVLSIGGTGAEQKIHSEVPQPKQPTKNTKEKPVAPELPKAIVTRTQEGNGHPIAMIPFDQKRAPWMVVALREAKQWSGKKEGEITKTDNYHELIGIGKSYPSLSGKANPWCASFVNYCLQEAGYTKAAASASSQGFRWDKNFVKIEKPIYGSIVVWTRKDGTGHVGFVYCLDKDNPSHIIRLGGNEDDDINFVARAPGKAKLSGYFVPIAYKDFALNEASVSEQHTQNELRVAFKTKLDSKTDGLQR